VRLAGARRPAALAAVAGSLLTRYAWLEAGKVSARDPGLQLAPKGGESLQVGQEVSQRTAIDPPRSDV
jgi:hypothetical protein